MAKPNVALVAGATGIVGEPLVKLLSNPDSLGGPWKVYALARRARPDWLPSSVVYVQCDLLDREDVMAKIAPLTDVTHLFWVTWVARATEAENVKDNERTLRNAVDAILPNAKGFQHIALQTGTKQYIGNFESWADGTPGSDNPFTEDMSRLPGLNFYYALEDVVFEVVGKTKGKVTWSVHRAGMISGASEGNLIGLLEFIAVYATVCKHEGLPFKFPSTEAAWNAVVEVSDADLVAEQELWAATDPRGKNEAFNIVNGDHFRWRRMWKSLADKLGVEYVAFDGTSAPTTESMKNMGPVWDKIVRENGLQNSNFEKLSWWLLDALNITTNLLASMNKSKEHGFFGFRNTEKTMLKVIDVLKEKKMIP